jgi:hypothetical protein
MIENADGTARLPWLRRNTETAAVIQGILGLPDHNWSDFEVKFGAEEPALAVVSIFLTSDQLVALAELAAR